MNERNEHIMHKIDKKLLLYLLIIPAYLLMIYLLSHQTGHTSNEISQGIIRRIIGKLFDITGKELTYDMLDTINYLFRKFLHFTEYMILAMLFYCMLKNLPLGIQKRLVFSVLPAVIYSVSDEFHQLFVPNRTGQISDIIIDSSGALIGALLMYLLERRKIKKFV